MAEVAVNFRVFGDVALGLSMFVVGDCAQLGRWNADSGVELQPTEITETGRSAWEGVVQLPAGEDIHYRFFIGKIIILSEGPENEVLWWETNVQPRHFLTPEQDEFTLPLAEFGSYDAQTTISNGWLKHQMCIQVRLHNNPIFMWKAQYREETYSIKCSPINYDPGMDSPGVLAQDDGGSMDGPPPCEETLLFYHNLNTSELIPSRQPINGCIYEKGDYLVFTARGANQKHLGFQLDFFVQQKGTDPIYVGSAHLLPPPKLDMSLYVKKVPIIGLKHRPIGEVTVEVLLIYPTPGYMGTMDVSYQNHWKWRKDGTTLNIGHRGMGSSYKFKSSSEYQHDPHSLSMVTENTVNSLISAGRHGADFVEFDVLLTKDLVPVIYHDFSVCLSYAQKGCDERQLLEIPVKDLNHSHLQSMKLYHTLSKSDSQIEVNPDMNPEDEQPFPTLLSCLEKVDINIGFNIEIKYPLVFMTGESELDNYFDLNPYIDMILNVVLKYAGDRKIIFSTFHPDTCLTVQLKQNKYPVLFLSNGPTKRYVPYKDWRCTTFEHGISFAKAEGLLGVDFQAEGLIQDLSLIPRIRSMGLVLFVWGEDLNSEEVKDTIRKAGVDGIIYDRIEKQHEEWRVDSSTDIQQVLSFAAHVAHSAANSLIPSCAADEQNLTTEESTYHCS